MLATDALKKLKRQNLILTIAVCVLLIKKRG